MAEVNNPLVENARQFFSGVDFKWLGLTLYLVDNVAPFLWHSQLAKRNPPQMDFFIDTSRKIIAQKRKEFEKKKESGNFASEKPSDFIELMLEVEGEMSNQEKPGDDNRVKKCKSIL